MNLKQKVYRMYGKSKLYLKQSSSTILCCIAAVGVVGTAVAAAKATPKAMKLLKEAMNENEKLSKVEVIIIVTPIYIPAIAIGVGTIFCIFGANVLNKHQQARLMSAYTVLESSYKEYRNKIKQIMGEDGERKINNEIVKTHLKNSDIHYADEEELFYDIYGKRYFNCTKQEVKDAEYYINRNMAVFYYSSLNDFYECLGLEKTDFGETVGWSVMGYDFYGYQWIDVELDRIKTDDGLECYVIYYPFEPHSDYLEC